MFPYIPITKQDEEKMLQVIGVKSIDDLFIDIPSELKLNKELDLPKNKSEIEIRNKLNKLANKNNSASDSLCFLGGGSYDSYIPSIVPYIASRSEFATAYTPYQPEISQGTLRATFEFQTLVCNLTDLHVSNASMYDGATAAAEAALMAFEKQKGETFMISKTVNPQVIEVVKTYLKFRNFNVVMIDEKDFVTDLENLKSVISKDVVGVLVQSPNYYGYVEDYTEVVSLAKENKALSIMYADPSSLGILKTPGEYEFDIAIGDLQSFGNGLNFGGPHIGYIATTKKLMRKLPGRIVGQSVDSNNKRAFVLTLQAREQHIRREKATSNICSNQALNALCSTIYMSLLGKKGIKEVAVNSTNKAHYLYYRLIGSKQFSEVTKQNFYREFLLKSVVDVTKLNNVLSENGVLPLTVINEEENIIQICVTEKRTKEELDYLVKLMEVI